MRDSRFQSRTYAPPDGLIAIAPHHADAKAEMLGYGQEALFELVGRVERPNLSCRANRHVHDNVGSARRDFL